MDHIQTHLRRGKRQQLPKLLGNLSPFQNFFKTLSINWHRMPFIVTKLPSNTFLFVNLIRLYLPSTVIIPADTNCKKNIERVCIVITAAVAVAAAAVVLTLSKCTQIETS